MPPRWLQKRITNSRAVGDGCPCSAEGLTFISAVRLSPFISPALLRPSHRYLHSNALHIHHLGLLSFQQAAVNSLKFTLVLSFHKIKPFAFSSPSFFILTFILMQIFEIPHALFEIPHALFEIPHALFEISHSHLISTDKPLFSSENISIKMPSH